MRNLTSLFLCGALVGALLASVAATGPARAQEALPGDRAASAEQDRAREDKAQAERSPLSAEDAALVRELALLEKVELLRNLELFEPIKERPRRKKSAQ
jgi:hypothetical protein